ncbi:MAG TPA: M48 family metallopeptidase [Chthoniobacterales bacterium]|nr:M48 family metallopeptidase [Chthoniobacterales bacterium]
MKFAVAVLAAALTIVGPSLQAQQPIPGRLTTAPSVSLDPAAATRAWLDTVPAHNRARSDAYFEGGYWLILWNFLLAGAIAIFLLASGVSARVRRFAERVTRSRILQPAVYAIPYVVIVYLLSFPLVVYSEFFREHAYGLANQTFGPWFGEQLISLLVDVIASAIVTMALYAVLRRAPRTWWLWGSALGFLFLALQMLIAPVFIAPLFNTYKPLADPKISQPILAMAKANQIPVQQVFEVDASRQSTRVSANVSGLFGTTRISLNDNLLKQCTLPEIRAVMAHEMGHYVLNHAFKLILYFSLFVTGAFAFSFLVFERAIGRWGAGWQVRGISDPAGLPLLVLLFTVYFFLITPLAHTAIRVTEREADAFGINTAREADGFAKVSLKLGAYRKLDPGPLEEFLFFDHPSGRARIRMAMDWKAANLPAGDAGR